MTTPSQAHALEPFIERLSAQLAAGETLVVDDIPQALIDLPVIQNLLCLARVNQALDHNRNAATTPFMPAQIGQWRIIRLLGQGGMGAVWLGDRLDASVEHQVAIKCVHSPNPRFVERLKRERQILAKLNHPNVAGFLDAGVDTAGLPWLAMEYVDGHTVMDWSERQQLGLEARLKLFLKICAGVAHAHRHLIVHRDIKPGNILVNAQGEPKLLDFGISKLLESEAHETTMHSLTPSYAAPEQLRGGVISVATDVYSLGLLLFRLIAGRLPNTRHEQSLAQVLVNLDHEETARPSLAACDMNLPYAAKSLQGDLDAIVFKALKLDPAARYDGAQALAQDVQRYLAREPVQARAPSLGYRLQRRISRHRLAFGFAAFAVLALLAGTGIALQQASRANAAAAAARTQAARADTEAEQARLQSRRALGSAQFLLKVFEQSDPMRQDARGAISLDQAFEDALVRARQTAASEPLLAIDLLDDFGQVLTNKGRFAEAETILLEALALIDQHYPKNSVTRAETLTNLLTLYQFLGKPDRANAKLDEALAILRPQPELDPILLGTLLMHAATQTAVRRDYVQAETLANQGLALHRSYMAKDDLRLPNTLATMGSVLRMMDGRLDDAQPFLDEAVALAERNQGFDSAALIALVNQQRSHANAMGDKDRTVKATERMLAIAEKAFPGTHPLHASALLELGSLRLILDPKSDGEALLQRALSMYQTLGNIDELRTWRLYHGGLVTWSVWAKALQVSAQALPRCKALQWSHAECIYLRAERVIALAQSERGAEALSEIVELEADVERFGLSGVDTDVIIIKARAEALLASGKKAEAISLLETLLATYTKRWGAEHGFTRQLKTCVGQWKAGERVYCTW